MRKITQAVIFVGGQGARLRPLTLTTPKPLLRIHGKPFAEYLVELLKRNGIEEIIFLTGYLAEQFPAYFGDGSKFGVRIRHSQGLVEDETGKRLQRAKPLLNEEFLLLYGDNYWPLNLEKLIKHREKTSAPNLVTVYERSDPSKKNNILVGETGLVEIYDKARKASGLNGVDIGFFILSRKALDLLPEKNVNFEETVLPKLIAKKELAGFLTHQPYWSLTDNERLPGVTQALDPQRKVLFLDRDGTLNVKAPKADYIKTPEAFVFLPGAIEALVALTKKGVELYVVSNQPGIARGALTLDTLNQIHKKMERELGVYGVHLNGIYFCPHGWDSACDCRKPKPGMFFQVAREHNIDLSHAVFVGDDERDKEAGDAAGVSTILVESEEGIATAYAKLWA
jgi:histidinol-phosphate phosphatase family protein